MYNVYCRSCKKEIANDIAICPHCKHDQSQVMPPPASVNTGTTTYSGGMNDTASAYAALEQGKAKQSSIFHRNLDGGGFDWRMLRWAIWLIIIPIRMCARANYYDQQNKNLAPNNPGISSSQDSGTSSDSR
jgi:hypothetical protein